MRPKIKRQQSLAQRKHPGDPEAEYCSPGSIEQQLDMCETGCLKGDEILHSHGLDPEEDFGEPQASDRLMNQSWNMDLSEENREGDEMSGDDHSSGLEGGDSEFKLQPHISTGMPGDRSRREELESRFEEGPFIEE
ncbi:MAG: hypothetical protein ACO3A2_00580 [Bdellovibrionia bacterium]